MSHRSHNKKRINKLYSLYVWHRYMGLTAALLVLVLSVTGLMLNHTERFQLNQSFIKSNWLLNWYNITLPSEPNSYQVSEQWITQIENDLFFNDKLINDEISQLHGAIVFNDIIFVAVDNTILLLTLEGELIEKLESMHGVPKDISAIGLRNNQFVALQAHGELYVADSDLLSWEELEVNIADQNWAKSKILPESMKTTFITNYRQHILSMEKVVLDLHSGRILGSYGIFVMDAAAIFMMLLAISGCSIWIIQKRKRKQNKLKRTTQNNK